MTDADFPDLDVGESLGRGSAGEVFRAVDKSLGREFAFKRFNAMSIDRRFLRTNFSRFERMPHHPGIVEVVRHRFDEAPYYVLMEMAKGKRLNARGRFVEDKAWEIVRSICDAMGHAHKYGVVHGNLHPGNIFLDDGGERFDISVADFGTGMIGDVHHIYLDENTYYAAPEQLQCGGCRWSEGAAQSWDVYRFGVIAFYLVNGELPRGLRYFKERERALVRSGGRPVPVDPVAFAETVVSSTDYRWNTKIASNATIKLYREIIDDCLRVDPKDRPVDLREVRNRFRALDHSRAIFDAEDRLQKEKRKQKAKLFGARAVAAVLGISFLLATYYSVDYFRKTYFFKNKVSELDQVVTSQKNHINSLDKRWENTVTDLKQSREAADNFFSKMAQGTDAGGSGVDQLGQADLEKSRQYYLQTLADVAKSQEAPLELARARHSLAHIEKKLGNEEESLKQFRRAVEAFHGTIANRREDPDALTDTYLRLADCHENITRLLPEPMGDKALGHLKDAVKNFEEVIRRGNREPSVLLRQAGTSFLLGKVLAAHEQFDPAVDAYSRAAELATELRGSSPDSKSMNELIGQLQFHAAGALRGANRVDDAINAHIAAMETVEGIRDLHGFTPFQSIQMAESYVELGELFALKEAGPEDLDQLYNESLRLLSPLNADNPEDVPIAMLLCRSLIHLGELERSEEHWAEGYRLSTRGIDTLKTALDSNPEVIEGVLQLAESRIEHLKFLEAKDDLATKVALRGVENAEAAQRILDEEQTIGEPMRSQLHKRLVVVFRAYGDVCKRLGQTEPSNRCYARAAESLSYLSGPTEKKEL